MPDTKDGGRSLNAPRWLTPALWVFLAVVTVALFGLAVLLLINLNIVFTRHLSNEQTKDLWAFLGIALGAVVTLIGTLLTEQHNRRTDLLARESSSREEIARTSQHALAKDAEERLTIDTIARLLELISIEDGYAPKARVAGALVALNQIRGSTVAIRILNELWSVDAIDANTACWLIDRALSRGRSEEADDAAALLALHARKLVPSIDNSDQSWYYWPLVITDAWPGDFSAKTKNSLIVAAIRVLLARDPEFWKKTDRFPIDMLSNALRDLAVRGVAACILIRLHDLGVLTKIDYEMTPSEATLTREIGKDVQLGKWFEGELELFREWTAETAVRTSSPKTVTATSADPLLGEHIEVPLDGRD